MEADGKTTDFTDNTDAAVVFICESRLMAKNCGPKEGLALICFVLLFEVIAVGWQDEISTTV